MSNGDVEDVKPVAEQPSNKLEDLTVTRGKLVDDMFVSATTYLDAYAKRTGDYRPLGVWTGHQENWRKTVTDTVNLVQTTLIRDYQRYDNLYKDIIDVATKEELDHAIALLKLLLDAKPPDLPIDPADRFLDIRRNVSYFLSEFNFPELNRHGDFIQESMAQFVATWNELRAESLKMWHSSDQAINTTLPMLFRRYIQLAMESVPLILSGLEIFVASLNLE